ncbi:glycosyltransferase family 4 protein [Curvibacter sp. RS43]|uniref:glycosyltransferase family 4 protein n=1 Tax=Curvibacter microcysteis TaxID=3026419 RepID=UPI00235F6467|nr:glycosyltransferase family 4 protein [Curvibacter sp. RS43]MDD0810222.1 glycosyltransferase family 4 protein [Curvibacter sp. RS43]
MNLLNINNYHYRRGGSDVMYFEHASIMQEEGWACAYFSMKHPNNIESPWSTNFIEELEYGHDYGLTRKAVSAMKVIYSWEAKSKLKKLLSDFRADIAHLHCIYHHITPSIIPLLEDRGVPIVMTAHDLKIACPAYKMLNKNGVCERCVGGSYLNLIKNKCIHDSYLQSTLIAIESSVHRYLKSYQSINKIIAPSKFYKEKFIQAGYSEQQIVYIPNFVDTPLTVDSLVFGEYYLYFGRLSNEKGILTLVKAFENSRVKLKIVGGGPMANELKEFIGSGQYNVELCGHKTGLELTEIIKGSRAVILPSEWYENAPMSVLESFSLGKPVIGSRIGGIPEMVQDGLTGFLFESGNKQDLSNVIIKFNSLSLGEYLYMGSNCRDLISQSFSKQAYKNRIRDLYSSILSQ